jgi:hypothetical protein|tara:strand:+ start:189 stop:584 length:396 start_codon:yes stop_codon:yes gene_type:complete
MNYKEHLYCFLKAYLNDQINDDEEKLLPSGSKAISIERFLEFLKTNEGLNKIFFSAFENMQNANYSINEYKLMGSRVKVVGEDKKLLDDFIINSYFSSKCVIDALSRRDKISSKEIDLELYTAKLKHQLER